MLRTRRSRGAGPRRPLASAIEQLEDRAVPATSFSYVNDNWHLVSDLGDPGLSVGDVVDDRNDQAGTPTFSAVYGVNAFGVVTSSDAPTVVPPASLPTADSINDAIAETTVGGTVNVLAGTYTENVLVNKRVTLAGAGSDATIITAATASTPTILITTGGADATNRLVVADLQATGATGGGNLGSGIVISWGGSIGFVTFDGVAAVNNAGHGIALDAVSGGSFTDLRVIDSSLSDNGSVGLRIPSSVGTFDGLTMIGGEVSGNGVIGLAVNPSISNTPVIDNISITGTSFVGNGTASFAGSELGLGDISIVGFNGNLTLTDVTVTGLATDGAHIGIQLRGKNASAPGGTVVFDNVTVTGSYLRPSGAATNPGAPGSGITIQNYTDVSAFTFTDVTVNTTEGHALNVAGLSNTLDLGNASLTAQAADAFHVAVGTSTQNPVATNVDATGATLGGVEAATATLDQLFAIEDKILHAIDVSGLGLVRVRDGNVYVTPDSFFAPATLTPSIQRGIDAATAGDTVNVAAGTYDEDVVVNKTVTLLGAGPGESVIRGVIGGESATVRVSASDVTVAGFTVTRLGNTVAEWNDPGLNSAGVAIQGLAVTNATIRDNLITGNRTGIDVNNSGGHTIRNNVVTSNHTGLIFRNQTDNLLVTENAIVENRTVGIVFLDASAGSNVPVQSALNSTFFNNNISGNWYAQIVDRQTGGALPAPGTTNLKDFSGNWFGTATPVVTTANSAEPGYADLIPVESGGTATAPGGQPDIAGPASANFDVTPLLLSGTDTDVETVAGRGTYGFQGDFSALRVTGQLAQTGTTGRIEEGANLAAAGGTVNVAPGNYAESANLTSKAVTLSPEAGGPVAVTGDLTLNADDALALDIGGPGADQLVVGGAVTLGGATLTLRSGATVPAGTTITLITNGGTDAVIGSFAGLAEGATVTFGGQQFTISYAGGDGNDVTLTAVVQPPQPEAPTGLIGVAAGAGGGSVVQLRNPDGSLRFALVAFEGFNGEVHVATGDVNGDLVEDLIVGAGPGANGHVKVFDGVTGATLYSFFAFTGFDGGVFVGAGDINNDGRADIIAGAGAGGPGGHVKVFDGLTGAEVRSFFAFPGFNGGVTVAGGDVNRDGFDDIVVGAGGAADGGHVKVFDGLTGAEVRSFFGYPGYFGGINVAAGDLNGDGFAEIITGADTAAPHVKAFDGATGAEILSFFAFEGFPGGVRVGAGDTDGDSLADILVGVGPGGGSHVKSLDGQTLATLLSFFALDPSFTGGVFVG